MASLPHQLPIWLLKKDAVKIPKSVIFFPLGASPVARQKNFEKNTHLCVTALEYIIGYISMFLEGSGVGYGEHK